MNRLETVNAAATCKYLNTNQLFETLAQRLLIVAQANAKLTPETPMKTKLQQLNMNDFAILFLAFGLMVGLALK